MQTEWFQCVVCVEKIGEMYSREIAVRDGFECWCCGGPLTPEPVEV